MTMLAAGHHGWTIDIVGASLGCDAPEGTGGNRRKRDAGLTLRTAVDHLIARVDPTVQLPLAGLRMLNVRLGGLSLLWGAPGVHAIRRPLIVVSRSREPSRVLIPRNYRTECLGDSRPTKGPQTAQKCQARAVETSWTDRARQMPSPSQKYPLTCAASTVSAACVPSRRQTPHKP